MTPRRAWRIVQCAVGGALLLHAATAEAANLVRPEDAPSLRPPKGEIPPGWWEEYGTVTLAAGGLALPLLGVVIWLLARPKPGPPLNHAALARQALDPFRRVPEDAAALARASAVVRHYFVRAFSLPAEACTTAEFCAALAAHARVGAGLAGAASDFLRRCDERKFAPGVPATPLGAVEQAFALIEAGERQRNSPAPTPAPPPPAPAAPSTPAARA